MLAFNFSILNTFSEGLGFGRLSVDCTCKPPTKDYTQIIILVYKGDVSSIQGQMCLDRFTCTGEIDGLNLIFINFYVPPLATLLHPSEAALQFSENITFFPVY
jgi:hypothetical protein